MTAYIPAWKRLGLQLKREPGGAEHQEILVEPPPKRQKIVFNYSDENNIGRQNAKSKDLSPSNTKALAQVQVAKREYPSRTKQDNQPKRRKSVTFDLSTKIVDGSSDTPPEEGDTVVRLIENGGNIEKKAKTRKRPKSSSAPQEKSAESSSQPYLFYLEQYERDRGAWKFKKNLQNHLLSNFFNLRRIPPSYDQALLNYISGLQGKDACDRLLEEARKILSASPNDTSLPKEVDDASTPAIGVAEDKLNTPATSAHVLKPRTSEEILDNEQENGVLNETLQSQLRSRARRLKEIFEVKETSRSSGVLAQVNEILDTETDDPTKQPRKRSRGRKRRLGSKAVNDMNLDSTVTGSNVLDEPAESPEQNDLAADPQSNEASNSAVVEDDG